MPETHPTLVGIIEISERLKVQRATVDKWRTNAKMPEPRWVISKTPLWDWQRDIVPWAIRTGRIEP